MAWFTIVFASFLVALLDAAYPPASMFMLTLLLLTYLLEIEKKGNRK